MRTGTEISWILEGITPDKITFARLAEYMQEFANLLGNKQQVHFARIEAGSTHLVAKPAAGEPAHKARSRITAIREHRAPRDAMQAYRNLNKMVEADGRNARIVIGRTSILRFPSKVVEPQKPMTIVDTGTITGRLSALSESSQGTIRASIRPRNKKIIVECTVETSIAKELRRYFLEEVRVQGPGQWVRDGEGKWDCKALHILKVSDLKKATLRDAINNLRCINADWPYDPIGDWATLDDQDGAA